MKLLKIQNYKEEIRNDQDLRNINTSWYNEEKRIRVYLRDRKITVVYVDPFGIEKPGSIDMALLKAITEELQEIKYI